jgi:hypothetical protein
MTLLVSISGALLSGKTTLAEMVCRGLGQDGEGVHDIPRHALERLEKGVVENNRIGFQHYIAFSQLLAESAPSDRRFRILDKSLIDALAYWNVLVGEEPPGWATLATGDRYALVVLCDHTEIEVERGDELRLPHLAYRERLAEEIGRIVVEMGCYVLRASGSPQQRMARVRQALDKIGA